MLTFTLCPLAGAHHFEAPGGRNLEKTGFEHYVEDYSRRAGSVANFL